MATNSDGLSCCKWTSFSGSATKAHGASVAEGEGVLRTSKILQPGVMGKAAAGGAGDLQRTHTRP